MAYDFTETGKGTYILHMRLADPTEMPIGKLGIFTLAAGWYGYVGSAFGGLRARLNHHLGTARRPHWHIDYLRQAAEISEIWYAVSPVRYEHQWANVLQNLTDAHVPIPRFGASDCDCPSHLFHFETALDFAEVGVVLGADVVRWTP